ncbi:MAG TPA: GNAT family N-acetyltransferase [Gemmatimonadales bacterium]|nr:GNAT family N-acetyltransferase [Gemmatimonadales bacterium]
MIRDATIADRDALARLGLRVPEGPRAGVLHPAHHVLVMEEQGLITGAAHLRSGGLPPEVTGPVPMELVRLVAHDATAESLLEAAMAAAVRRGARTLWASGARGFVRPLAGPEGVPEIVEFRDGHAGGFYALNRFWLDQHGLYEPADEAQLADPWGAFLEPGGAILIALIGDAVVGTSAVVPHAPGEAEVAKLTVVPGLRGQGLGRRLVEASLARVRADGYRRAVLVSSSKLGQALRLYESLGFERRPLPPDVAYATADVWMELEVGPAAPAPGQGHR